MPIKNYATRVPADRSISEIQVALRRLKVRQVHTEYDNDGNPCALAFTLDTDWGRRSYLLPANIQGVARALERQGAATRLSPVDVGWRSIKDWVEAQVALLEAGAANLTQVMLPYMQDESGRTVYDLASERYQPALPAGKA